MRILIKALIIGFGVVLLVALFTISRIDRTPYKDLAFYKEMDARLDSLGLTFAIPNGNDILLAGWSKINISPEQPAPLAGFGARDPKEMKALHDSSFVRTIVLQNGHSKVAIVTADLLIIHPELAKSVWKTLPDGWVKEDVYFTATHTHSGRGGWAPGLVGKLFAGEFEEQTLSSLSQQIITSIEEATSSMDTAQIAFSEISIDDLVKNRLIKNQGIIDPWMKVLRFQQSDEQAMLTFFSAHATCLGADNHDLSGDFPAAFIDLLSRQHDAAFTAYAAGAVGSMGPNIRGEDDWQNVNYMAESLAEQIGLMQMLNGAAWQNTNIRSFQLKLPMRAPAFKISENWALKPCIFEWAFGNYPHFLSVLQLNDVLLVGLPGDFSGELAVPLYHYARLRNLNLIISSFNGDYAGYIIKDEWYDLPKYEARTMSWYGPDAGSYLSEVIQRIIDITYEHQKTNTSHR